MTEVGDLETKLGHRFAQPSLLDQALTHGSVRHEQQTGDAAETTPAIEDNERLEFLGDAIVGMVVAELLYRRYPELDEGELTRLRAALVSRRHLGLVGTGLDLGSYLRLGKAEERNGGRRKSVLLANCMEALIGAVYLEGGLPAATNFVERTIVEPYMEDLRGKLRDNPAIGDYKTALQELLQARRSGQPEYMVEGESGPDHRKRFLVAVHVSAGGRSETAKGEGSTKKMAEQEAARKLYESLSVSRDANPLSEELSPRATSELDPAASERNRPEEEHARGEEIAPGWAKSAATVATSRRKRVASEGSASAAPVIGPAASLLDDLSEGDHPDLHAYAAHNGTPPASKPDQSGERPASKSPGKKRR